MKKISTIIKDKYLFPRLPKKPTPPADLTLNDWQNEITKMKLEVPVHIKEIIEQAQRTTKLSPRETFSQKGQDILSLEFFKADWVSGYFDVAFWLAGPIQLGKGGRYDDKNLKIFFPLNKRYLVKVAAESTKPNNYFHVFIQDKVGALNFEIEATGQAQHLVLTIDTHGVENPQIHILNKNRRGEISTLEEWFFYNCIIIDLD